MGPLLLRAASACERWCATSLAVDGVPWRTRRRSRHLRLKGRIFGLLGWDRQLSHWVVGHRVGLLDPVAQGLSFVGAWALVWFAIALGLAVARRRPGILVWTLVADLLAATTTSLIKEATDRDRPDVDVLVDGPSSSSFPSGHASSSFACATVLGAFVPSWRAPLYVLAAAIAWSRVYVGVHYPLDVVAGAIWGIVIGLVVVRAPRPLAADLRRSRRAPRPG